jgi:hypothetical protein
MITEDEVRGYRGVSHLEQRHGAQRRRPLRETLSRLSHRHLQLFNLFLTDFQPQSALKSSYGLQSPESLAPAIHAMFRRATALFCGELIMADILLVISTAALFAVALLYVNGCDRLKVKKIP